MYFNGRSLKEGKSVTDNANTFLSFKTFYDRHVVSSAHETYRLVRLPDRDCEKDLTIILEVGERCATSTKGV